ncbi:MAG TPA: ATP-binding protein [Bdellovibrionales bacterium]|nr:ATP-binding protein [Bdellovibrionales bacterium]
MSLDGLSGQEFNNLRSAIDEAAIVAITDKRGIITYVNKKFCAISKYSANELIGKTHKVVNSGFHPEEFFIDMWKTITAGKTWEGEIRNRAKDGTHYWVNTTIVPFMGSDGKPERYVAVRYEITERKLAEEQLKLQARKLEISNRELEDFASVAAHDLQEPLRKIQAFSDRLKAKAEGTLVPEAVDYVNRIQNSAQRMQTLIIDLLSYSRVTTKAQPFVPIDLNQIVSQVVSDLIVRLEKTGGKVVFKDLPTINADSSQMNQLFLNLINNALKFHRPGIPPVVEIKSRVLKGPRTRLDKCEITIQDNGIGFDEKYVDRIFTIFQRLHGRNEYEGTGIGLAVCRKIIDRHEGQITANSIPGEGSTFIITLPMHLKSEAPDEQKQ